MLASASKRIILAVMNELSPRDDLERRARAAFAQEDFSAAEILFRQLTEMSPADAVAPYNLGVTLGKLDRIEEAIVCYRRALELNPAFADACINYSTALNEFNLVEQARQGFALAQQMDPDNPVPVLNEGIAALTLGDYATGWGKFSARWRLPLYAKFKRDFSQPYWRGEDLSRKTIFLFAEQGFGDTIQMARYIPLLSARGARVIVEMPPALTRLLDSVQGSLTNITKGDPIPAFDTYCSMMDIPRGFGTRVETIPAQTPYLFADKQDIAAFPALSAGKKRRIGLCWSGRPSHENNHNRSLSFAQIAPWLEHGDIEWVSLQRVVPDNEVEALAASPMLDWGQHFADFASAAAAIMNVDLVITVDTAIAHLAGALGKKVWILLPYYADWRWLMGRSDSPWYPSATLFRQQKRREWGPVLSLIAASLKH